MMNTTLLKKMELWGVFFIFGAGTLLHFVYQWSNGTVWSILFGAVNESIWEHIKIFAMPYLVWSGLEFAFAKPYFRKFLVSKVIGVYFLTIIIIVFNYIYTGIVGTNYLWIDIISVFIWILLANVVSYKLMTSELDLRQWFSLGLFGLGLYAIMYFSFTAAPPEFALFRDPLTGRYGIFG